MNTEKRQEIERKVVRHLIRTMKAHGWYAVAVDDGGGEWERTSTETEVMDAVFSVDESWIKFSREITAVGTEHTVYIVLGNDGYDCICDHSYSEKDDFGKIMEEHVDPYISKLEEEQ